MLIVRLWPPHKLQHETEAYRTQALVNRPVATFSVEKLPRCCILEVLDRVVRIYNDIRHHTTADGIDRPVLYAQNRSQLLI